MDFKKNYLFKFVFLKFKAVQACDINIRGLILCLPAIFEDDLVVISENLLEHEKRAGRTELGHHHVLPDLQA